jgi:membrane protease YdiL (CAAX protease family)
MPTAKESLATLGQFGPFVAAMIVTWATDGRAGLRELLSRLVRWRVGLIWYPISLLLLPALMLIAILLYSWSQGAVATLRFHGTLSTLPAHFVYTLLLCGPLGEEPGWRGFALPRLQARHGAIVASMVLGVLGAVWHLPLWWIVLPPPCPFPVFVVGAVLLTLLFTWVFNHTRGSVFISLLLHASMNTASMRLPEVPAYPVWVVCLLLVALLVLFFDRRLGFAIDVSTPGRRVGRMAVPPSPLAPG